MASYIIGSFHNGQKTVGYRVYSLRSGGAVTSLRDISTQDLEYLLSASANAKLMNAELDASTRHIKFTQGAKSAYPIMDTNGVCLTVAGITVLYEVVDDNDVVLGFGIVDNFGTTANITKQKLIALNAKYKNTNWEVYTLSDGTPNVRAKSGSFAKVEKRTAIAVKAINSALDSADELAKKQKANAVAAAQLKAIDEADDAQRNAYMERDMQDNKAEIALALARRERGEAGLGVGATHTSSEVISLHSDNILPCVKIYDLADCFEGEYNKDAQIKLTYVKANLSKVAPYYASMFGAIAKTPSTAVPTMGVSEDTLFYNPKFLAQLTVAEATFVLVHEMLHLAMQHSLRHGTRNNMLWNIACDLIINETICRDFGCTFCGGEVEVQRVSKLDGKKYLGVIKTVDSGVFLSTIGETLDFAKDSAESVYARLVKENPQILNNQGQNGQQGNSGQSSQGQGGQSQGGQSGQGQGQTSQSSQGGQSSQGQGQTNQQSQGSQQQQGQTSQGSQNDSQGSQNQGQGQSSQQSQGSQNGSQQQQGQGQGQGQNEQQQGQQGNQQGQSEQTNPLENAGNEAQSPEQGSLANDLTDTSNPEYSQQEVEVEVSYNGKIIRGKIALDIVSNRDIVAPDNPKRSMDETRTAIQRIRTKNAMDVQAGKDMSKSPSTVMVDREMEFAMVATYNWKSILRNLANAKPRKRHSFAKPNTRHLSRGITLPKKSNISKYTAVQDIKFGVDVSGSIGQKELNIVFAQIKQILNQYDVEAEMVYWDTSVTNVGEFSTLKELLKIQPTGSGGTDVRCLFDYLMGRTRCNGKSEDTSVKDISSVFIFTDGYIGSDYGEFKRAFGAKTYWVIPDSSRSFKPLFGKVVIAQELSI